TVNYINQSHHMGAFSANFMPELNATYQAADWLTNGTGQDSPPATPWTSSL
ncbi:unnamed protein product, partial [Closterium sp. Yama58-4]